MPNRIFLDTSYVIALVNRRDQYHQQALELAAQYDGASFVTTEAVLLEIGNALAGAFKTEAVRLIEAFRSDDAVEIVPLSASLFEEGFRLYRTHRDKTWGLVDCISFAAMQAHDVQQVLTFDQHFAQAGFTTLAAAM